MSLCAQADFMQMFRPFERNGRRHFIFKETVNEQDNQERDIELLRRIAAR